MSAQGGVGLAESKSAPDGGRNFLPLPIFASVVFIVLAAGSGHVAPAGSAPATTSWPNMAQLWAQANAGQLDTNETYFAKDVIRTLQVTPSDVTVSFRTLPGQSFTLPYWNYVVTTYNIETGTEVIVFLEYDGGEWTVPGFFPASLFPY